MHPTTTRALRRDDAYSRFWALNWGVRHEPPAKWVTRGIAVAREDITLLDPLYQALGRVDWPTLKGPLAAVLFDSAAPVELRSMLWIFWAQHEAEVPDFPAEPELITEFAMDDQPRAERIVCERGGVDDPELAFIGLCMDPDVPLDLVFSTMQGLTEDDVELGWRELVHRFGTPDSTLELPDPSIVASLDEPHRTRAQALLDGLSAHHLDPTYTDRLLLRIGSFLHEASLPVEELVQRIAHQRCPSDHQISWVKSAITSDEHALALATSAAETMHPRGLLQLFADRIPEQVAELLVTHWSHHYALTSMVEPLHAAPQVLRAIAAPFLRGPNASDVLAALAYADPSWAIPLLLDDGEAILGGLDNENPFWNALVGLGDARAIPFVREHFLPHHLTRGWAWQTLAGLHDEPVPRLDLPDPDIETIEHPTTLRVECDTCGVWTTHAVSGATVVPLASVAAHFDIPDDWDGVTPNEPLTCPACDAVDEYLVADADYQELLLAGTRRTLADPRMQHRLGISSRPRIFAGELALRPSFAERELLRRMESDDSIRVREGWLMYLYLTVQDERLVEQGLLATERWPEGGVLHWYLALGAELTEAIDIAIEAAKRALPLCREEGPLNDCLGVLEHHAGTRFLAVAWRWEGRTLRGCLDLREVKAARFLAELDRIEVTPGEAGPPGWVERWMRGERPASREEQRLEVKRKKAARKKQKSRRKR